MQQGAAHLAADLWELIGERTDALNRAIKLLDELNPESVILAGVPSSRACKVGLGTMPNDDRDHFLSRADLSKSAFTASHGRLASGCASRSASLSSAKRLHKSPSALALV